MHAKLKCENIRRILLIKMRGIGDVLLSTIVLRNLRIAFPAAEIDFLTEPPSEPILRQLPLLNQVLTHGTNTSGSLKAILDVRKRAYDMIIDLYSNPRSALITRMSGALYRVGFRLRGRSYAYNIRVERESNLHAADHNLLPLHEIGVEILSRQLEFVVPESNMIPARQFIVKNVKAGCMIVGFVVGGGWPSKRCTPGKLAQIGDALVERFSAEIIIVSGPGDRGDAEKIHEAMRHRTFLLPQTDLLEASAFMKHCHAVIANDSGPMHVAAAVGTPTLGIFGPTNPFAHGPYGRQHEWVRKEDLDCICCNLLECPIQHQCMTGLSVNEVMRAFERLISKNRIKVTNANTQAS
jgi:lipopolysaccharide heptosyltransferase II